MTANNIKRPIVPRQFRGVRVVWTGRQFKFRGVAEVSGERLVGPLRTDAASAHQDYLSLCARRAAPTSQPTSLGQAIDRLLLLKRQSGTAGERWLRTFSQMCDLLREAWDPSTPARTIDAAEITWFVGAMRERGYSANTIAQKMLPTLRATLRVAGVVWPTVGVPRVSTTPPIMDFFTLEEVGAVLARIESHPNHTGLGGEPHRQRFVDVVRFMTFTGARLGEVERLRVGHIDLERRTALLTNNKAGGRRDLVYWPATLDESMARLVARAADGVLVPNCKGWTTACFARWKRLLEEPRLSGRTLRHTFVSAVLETSRDLAVTRDAARHSSLTMTNRYVHAASEKKLAVVDQLALRLPVRSPGS